MACADHETAIIGIDVHTPGVVAVLDAVENDPLPHVRVVHGDALRFLTRVPNNSLDAVRVYFPDPWPKKRHWKRRFLNEDNVKRFHRVLKAGGEFRFASDIESYVNWGLRHVFNHGGFDWTANKAPDWHEAWAEWISTRYEKKAIREGRTPCYMIFEKHS